jgi:hypothetical protein
VPHSSAVSHQTNITNRESLPEILDNLAEMIIMYHINRIDFARNRVTMNIFRGVTGWRVNDAFGARVNRIRVLRNLEPECTSLLVRF